MFLIIIAIIALVVLKAKGVLPISWTTLALIAGLIIFIPTIMGSSIFSFAARPKDIEERDTCGCYPTQKAVVNKRGVFGRHKKVGVYPCADALAVASRNRHYLAGCVN